MPEIAILHVCPHCGRVFDSPSFCVDGQCETEPRPETVPKQWMTDQSQMRPEGHPNV